MGEVELIYGKRSLLIHSVFFIYGDAANAQLATQIAADVETHWNEAAGRALIRGNWFEVRFSITGKWDPELAPLVVLTNTDPRNNYFRVEEYVSGNISFVDAIHSNTGYFKLENLLHNSTTAAHEYGHTIGLEHPEHLDIRGKGTPGIMYPRGTLVDPPFQYYPDVQPGEKGGTLNPFTRKVLAEDIDLLKLHRLAFNSRGLAVLGDFTSVWHDKHLPVQGD